MPWLLSGRLVQGWGGGWLIALTYIALNPRVWNDLRDVLVPFRERYPDALVVCTEWNQFRNPDFDRLRSLFLLSGGRDDPADVGQEGRGLASTRDEVIQGRVHVGAGEGLGKSGVLGSEAPGRDGDQDESRQERDRRQQAGLAVAEAESEASTQ